MADGLFSIAVKPPFRIEWFLVRFSEIDNFFDSRLVSGIRRDDTWICFFFVCIHNPLHLTRKQYFFCRTYNIVYNIV